MKFITVGTVPVSENDIDMAKEIHEAVMGDSGFIKDLSQLTFAEITTLLIKANALSEIVIKCKRFEDA